MGIIRGRGKQEEAPIVGRNKLGTILKLKGMITEDDDPPKFKLDKAHPETCACTRNTVITAWRDLNLNDSSDTEPDRTCQTEGTSVHTGITATASSSNYDTNA